MFVSGREDFQMGVMPTGPGRPAVFAFFARALLVLLAFSAPTWANPKAEILLDLHSGTILHSRNDQERLHPASLTKMMTIYLTFSALRDGQIQLDSRVTVSRNAAGQPPSRMNLKSGDTITIADLVRGVAVQSANDGAVALAEAVGGSERAFVARMNQTAQAMGMAQTTFANPHGLTDSNQLSTARDLAILARRLRGDFPEHYGLFGLSEIRMGERRMLSTNRRFLSSYQGATGLKTGYTRTAGYNLAATAQRGGVEMLTIVLGAGSSPERMEKASALLDYGFSQGGSGPAIAALPPLDTPVTTTPAPAVAIGNPEHQELRAALSSPGGTALLSDIVEGHGQSTTNAGVFTLPNSGGFRPLLVASQEADWGVQIGLYPTRYMAEKVVLETTLANLDRLGGAPHSIVRAGDSWSAAYMKMGKRQAESACRHLLNNGVGCAIFHY